MKKSVVFLLLLCAAAFAAGAAEAPSVWMVAEIRGLSSLAEQAERLAADFEAPLKKDDLLAMVGGMLMAPGLSGVDAEGLVRFFVLEAPGGASGAPRVAITLPVTDDGKTYLDGVGMMLEPGEAADGIEAFHAAPGMGAMIQNLFAVRLEGRLLLAQEQDTARDVAAALRDGALRDERLPVDGALALAVAGRKNIARIEPLIDQMASAASGAPAGTMDAGRLLKAQFGGMLKLLAQVEQFMIGLGADERGLTVSSMIEPSAGSVLERVIGELRAPSAAYASLAPEGALLGAAGFVAVPDEFLDAYAGMSGEIYAAMGDPWTGLSGKLVEVVGRMKGQFLGDYAFAVLPGTGSTPVDFIQAFAIRDPARMQEATDEIIAAMQDIAPSAEQPVGMKLTKGEPRDVDGVSVTAYRYEMAIPAEMEKDMPAVLGEWLGDMTYEMAFVDQAMLYTLGSPAAMDRLIAAVKKGDGTPIRETAAVRALWPDLPAAATDIHYLKLMDLVRIILKSVPEAPPELADALPASPVALAGYSIAEGRNLASHLRIAHADLRDLGAFFRGLAAKSAPAMTAPAGMEDESWMEDEDEDEDEEEDVQEEEESEDEQE